MFNSRFVYVCILCLVGCAHDPFDPKLGCTPVSVDVPSGWRVLECAHPFASRSPDDGPRGACGSDRYSAHPGVYLPCGWTDATSDCAAREIKIWEHARAGAYEHEVEHARRCGR